MNNNNDIPYTLPQSSRVFLKLLLYAYQERFTADEIKAGKRLRSCRISLSTSTTAARRKIRMIRKVKKSYE